MPFSRCALLRPKLHPALWVRHLDKANFSIELVGVSSAEQEKGNATHIWVIDRSLDDELAESLATERCVNKDIAQPPEGGSVGDPSGEANLRP